jgi:sugar phosphate isomerase/epimerase
MDDVEVIGLYWTLSGPVKVHFGREWSLFDFADRCAAAERVGFTGIGIWHADLEHVLETRTLAEMRQILDAHGLAKIELEFLNDWYFDEGDERRAASDKLRRLLFDAAATLGAHHIKVGNIHGGTCPVGQIAERYAELCADAASQHDALIVYEFMPFDPNVNSIETVLEVVGGAGAPNGGIVIDTWHMAKLGIAPDGLREIPPELVRWVELSDGQVENMEDRIDEVINHRRLPGEGEFDITGYVRVCRDMGYEGPWGVEVLSEDLRSRPMDEIFQRAYETTMAQLGAAVA